MTDKILYEGKAKVVFATDDPNVVRLYYKDDATAFNGVKKGTIDGKGYYNNAISEILFKLIEEAGVPTQLIERTSEREMLAHTLKMIPLEVVVRNVAAGSASKRLGIPEGTPFKRPTLEFFYKDDDLGDPLVNEYHIFNLMEISSEDLELLGIYTFKVNDAVRPFLLERGIRLIDFKVEYGYDNEGRIRLGDELSPDSCRFWDAETNEKMDKDRFRRDLGDIEAFYAEVLRRVSNPPA
ncbi:MAG: phosphoribosylaminoimidazolesuccinocarboxamide synthase [Candidatus Coatesbacteria bacterium]|nr:phosphoribosylaminoimidazolesuccinocarboxamide synthase [Candidatus Coatesbacteria bacterium]